MSWTINTVLTGPVVLAKTDNPVTITATGKVTSTASGADSIDGGSGTSWNITNYGTVSSRSAYGIKLSGSASMLSNSGSIWGTGAVVLSAGGSVTYASGGTIFATGTSGALSNI